MYIVDTSFGHLSLCHLTVIVQLAPSLIAGLCSVSALMASHRALVALLALLATARAAYTLYAVSDQALFSLSYDNATGALATAQVVQDGAGSALVASSSTVYVLTGNDTSIGSIKAFGSKGKDLSQIGQTVASGGLGAARLAISPDESTLVEIGRAHV